MCRSKPVSTRKALAVMRGSRNPNCLVGQKYHAGQLSQEPTERQAGRDRHLSNVAAWEAERLTALETR